MEGIKGCDRYWKEERGDGRYRVLKEGMGTGRKKVGMEGIWKDGRPTSKIISCRPLSE
jgi:hypothetical protein